MADQQFGVSPEAKEAFRLKQEHRKNLRNYFLKQVTNPHRHATGEGGFVFDPAMFRFMAMRAKEYDYFRPTPINGFYAFLIIGAPCLAYGWLIKRDRDRKESSLRNGEVSYRDRQFKLI